MKTKFFLAGSMLVLFVIACISLTSCSKDDDDNNNQTSGTEQQEQTKLPNIKGEWFYYKTSMAGGVKTEESSTLTITAKTFKGTTIWKQGSRTYSEAYDYTYVLNAGNFDSTTGNGTLFITGTTTTVDGEYVDINNSSMKFNFQKDSLTILNRTYSRK